MSENIKTKSLTLLDIISLLVRRWKTLAVFSILTAVIITIICSFSPVKYTTTMVLGEVNNSSSSKGDLGGVLDSYFNDSRENSGIKNFIFLMTSYETVSSLKDKDYYMKTIFGNQWNEKDKEWEKPFSFMGIIKGIVALPYRVEMWHSPSDVDLQEFFIRSLKTQDIDDTDYISLSIVSGNPELSRKILMDLYLTADNVARKRSKLISDSNIEHITNKLDKNISKVYAESLITLLMSEEMKVMSLNPEIPYSAQIISAPITSSYSTYPRPFLTFVVGLIIGLMIGVQYILVKYMK